LSIQFQEVQAKNAALEYKALYISLEHRYYGLSLPFREFTTDNMKYLSSEQVETFIFFELINF
tara:strand:+ start:662 stop:850 length:189 start_codon:yes stop_codon:yes gene_type:complete